MLEILGFGMSIKIIFVKIRGGAFTKINMVVEFANNIDPVFPSSLSSLPSQQSQFFVIQITVLKNSIVNQNKLSSVGSLMHYKECPSNYLFHLFLTLYGRPEENSSYFSNVQPCTMTCTLDAFIK